MPCTACTMKSPTSQISERDGDAFFDRRAASTRLGGWPKISPSPSTRNRKDGSVKPVFDVAVIDQHAPALEVARPAARSKSVVLPTAELTIPTVSPARDPLAHALREELDLAVETLGRAAIEHERLSHVRRATEARRRARSPRAARCCAARAARAAEFVQPRRRAATSASSASSTPSSRTASSPDDASASSNSVSRARSSKRARSTVAIIAGSSSTHDRARVQIVEQGAAFVERQADPGIRNVSPRVQMRDQRRARAPASPANSVQRVRGSPRRAESRTTGTTSSSGQTFDAALRLERERAHALDRIAEELDASRPVGAGGKEIEDAAAHRVFPRRADDVGAPVSETVKPRERILPSRVRRRAAA